MRQSGFILSPTLWLAVGVGLLAVTTGLMYKNWQNAVEREAKVKGEYANFVEAVKLAGEQQQAEVAALEKQWKTALVDQRTRANRDRTALRAELDRMREHPTDPSGREIAVSTCAGTTANAVPAKLVPLADYESLQERAANDALQVTELQDYVNEICLKRAANDS